MRNQFNTTLYTLALISFVALQTLSSAIVWDGGGTGDDWSTPENWDGDILPGSGDVAEVGTGGVSINVTSDVQASYFSNTDGAGNLVTPWSFVLRS